MLRLGHFHKLNGEKSVCFEKWVLSTQYTAMHDPAHNSWQPASSSMQIVLWRVHQSVLCANADEIARMRCRHTDASTHAVLTDPRQHVERAGAHALGHMYQYACGGAHRLEQRCWWIWPSGCMLFPAHQYKGCSLSVTARVSQHTRAGTYALAHTRQSTLHAGTNPPE